MTDLFDRALIRWIVDVSDAHPGAVLARVRKNRWRVYTPEGIPLGGHRPTPWLAWKSAAERLRQNNPVS